MSTRLFRQYESGGICTECMKEITDDEICVRQIINPRTGGVIAPSFHQECAQRKTEREGHLIILVESEEDAN